MGMNDVRDALVIWLNRLEIRGPLTARDRDVILSFPGSVRTYRPSRDIVQLGERTSHVSLVVGGIVGRFGQTRNGARQLTALHIKGDMCDLHSAVLPVVSAPLQSTQDVTIYRIAHEDIREAAERSASLARAFWRDCAVDAQIASEWLLNIGRRTALSRLAHLICELATRYVAIGRPAADFALGMTQSQLGEATGLTGVHINRTLRTLRQQQLIGVTNGSLTILDWHGLAALAEFDSHYLHLGERALAARRDETQPASYRL
ncbi:Crp/Fnr family transcriptional regulator [Nostoc sp. 3335mG]|nr:Crp/Fnr family transcriptional regulator [Nostoc sp. 3335mG]